jgi:hypothetical protein
MEFELALWVADLSHDYGVRELNNLSSGAQTKSRKIELGGKYR